MFNFFKKNKQEDPEPMTKDEEQIAKAKEDIAKKGDDSQSEKDRIDESVGEQERKDGNENSQTAKDRVDESEGAEKADEKRKEERFEEMPAWAGELLSAIKGVAEMLSKQAKAESNKEEAAAENMKTAFGVGNGAFPSEQKEEDGKQITPAEVASTIRKLGM